MGRALSPPRRPHVVLATREVWPFVPGGGIGRHVSELARVLAPLADVTVLTSSAFRAEHDALRAAGDPRLPEGVTFAWAVEPTGERRPLWSLFHAWSLSFWSALRDLAKERPVDLVEFEDYAGAGAVTCDARRAGAEEVAATRIAVRLHTTWEMLAELDREPVDTLERRTLIALERLSLRFADVLLHPSDRTLAGYERFYGADALAPVRERMPVAFLPAAAPAGAPPAEGPMRLLYVGRLQAVKGVSDLVAAFAGLPDAALALTLVGRDTPTGPGRRSMREHLERLIEGDPRVTLREQVHPEEMPALMAGHHVVVVPSRFESFGYVVREALAANRPVLATPVGGIPEGFVEGRSGWLADGASPDALRAALDALAARREEAERLIADGAPRATVEAATDMDALAEAYAALALGARAAPARGAAAAPTRVVAVVAIGPGDGPLDVTLDSLAAQRWPGLEVVLAAPVERVRPAAIGRVDRLAFAAPGPGERVAAWRAALAGRATPDAVLLLSAGDVLEFDFLAEATRALASPARPAYATGYTPRGGKAGAPLGNAVAALFPEHDAAASIALVRGDDLVAALAGHAGADCAERTLFAELAARQRYGVVIPEPIVAHRAARDCPPGRARAELSAIGSPGWATG